jgi:hypothetical protein
VPRTLPPRPSPLPLPLPLRPPPLPPPRRRRRAPGDIVGPVSDTSTEAAGQPYPSPIFSPDDSLDELWVRAYQGEVLGEALFGLLADKAADPDHAAKLRVLSELERKTKDAIAPALERAGLPTEPDPEMKTLADALAVDMAWTDFLAATEAITVQFIPLYERIGALDPSERAASDLLVAHEDALRSFARAEQAGDTATSLDAINALAHMR